MFIDLATALYSKPEASRGALWHGRNRRTLDQHVHVVVRKRRKLKRSSDRCARYLWNFRKNSDGREFRVIEWHSI